VIFDDDGSRNARARATFKSPFARPAPGHRRIAKRGKSRALQIAAEAIATAEAALWSSPGPVLLCVHRRR
jgi:hypothetical protein